MAPPDRCDADGWFTAHLIGETEEVCAYVLSFGPQMEVIEPAMLRAKVVALARDTAGRYI